MRKFFIIVDTEAVASIGDLQDKFSRKNNIIKMSGNNPELFLLLI